MSFLGLAISLPAPAPRQVTGVAPVAGEAVTPDADDRRRNDGEAEQDDQHGGKNA
ncbi:MAG: hypothetical protein OEN01_14300 [Candidatus Krumholzibacteria bacterium]|nr:hypothetical protein [Candidatus Krumholzibacteria bacterium]